MSFGDGVFVGAASVIICLLTIVGLAWVNTIQERTEFRVRCECANGIVLAGKCIPKDTKFIEIKLGGEK